MDWAGEVLKRLMRHEGTKCFEMHGDAWAVIRQRGQRPLVLHKTAVNGESRPGTARSVVILVHLDPAVRPTQETLQRIFALSPAEAKLAIGMASGKSLDEFARIAKITLGTARKQLSSVFGKTSVTRQSELIALLARVSILP